MTCRLRRQPAGLMPGCEPHGLGLNGRSLYFCAQLHDHLVLCTATGGSHGICSAPRRCCHPIRPADCHHRRSVCGQRPPRSRRTARQCGQPSSNAGETTATFSRRAQELSARQTQEVRQAQDTQDQDRMTARQTSDAMQARQVVETDAAAEANRRATAQSTATEVGVLGVRRPAGPTRVDSMSAAG